MARKQPPRFNPKIFLAKVSKGKTYTDLSQEADYLFARGYGGRGLLYP